MKEMILTRDPQALNGIFNAPGCREEHFPPGHLDKHPDALHDTTFIINEGGFGVLGDRMAWLYNRVGVGTYEGHTAVLPEKRGPGILAYFAQSIETAFMESDAMSIYTRCPVDNHNTNQIAKRLHFNFLYVGSNTWGGQDMNVYSLPIDVWAAHNRKHIDKGKWLHDEFERNGGLHDEHEDDDDHFASAGVALELALRGQPHKGEHIYNVRAQMSGYDPVAVICLDPLIIRTVWRDRKDSIRAEMIDYKVTREGLERI